MQTTIYFVRHGKVYNPTDILYGRLPHFGLGKEGRIQIEQTAKFLKNERIDAIYASPMLRTKQTAEIIQKTIKAPLSFSRLLLEVKTSMQGKSFSYIKTLNYDIFAGAGKNITGETINQVADRLGKFMQFVIKKYPGKKVVAVTHGDPLMLVRAKLTGLPIVNQSLRPGPEDYVQQGEIYKVTCDEYIPLTIESIFKPKLP